MKDCAPISLNLHAAGDFIALTFLLVSPWLLGFSQHSMTTQYTVALVVIGMGLNFVTDYTFGAVQNSAIQMASDCRVNFSTNFYCCALVFLCGRRTNAVGSQCCWCRCGSQLTFN